MIARLITLAMCLVTLAMCLATSAAWAQPAEEMVKANPSVPEVLLSAQHEAMVKAGVGAAFPELSLPTAAEPTGNAQPIADQLGTKATVVAVVDSPSPMAKMMLRDLEFDIAEAYTAEADGSAVVATLAIATSTPPRDAIEQATTANYDGPLLLDEDGAAFAQLGTQRLPRVYVLNADGQIEWLDIEYSLSTRREMRQAVRALAGKPAK